MNSNKTYTKWDVALATGFYSGYSPFAPGTMGALVATLIWLVGYFSLDYTCLQIVTSVAIFVFTLLSIPSIDRLEMVWGEDPSRVVVDEMVGVWISLLAVPADGHWGNIAGAFVLFRLFDIVKPLGVRRMERIGGGWGVMLDDILAGVYGAIVLFFINMLLQ